MLVTYLTNGTSVMKPFIPISISNEANTACTHQELVVAVLNEIDEALNKLNHSQQESAIDLRSIFSADQTHTLKNILGNGEVYIKLNLGTLTEIEETSIQGVWWTSHFDEKNNRQCELIEIAYLPKMLTTSSEEIQYGQKKLRSIKKHIFSE